MADTALAADAVARRYALVERLFLATVATWDVLAVYIGGRLGPLQDPGRARPHDLRDLAAAAGLSERYAREWLEQQASTAILDYLGIAAPGLKLAERTQLVLALDLPDAPALMRCRAWDAMIADHATDRPKGARPAARASAR